MRNSLLSGSALLIAAACSTSGEVPMDIRHAKTTEGERLAGQLTRILSPAVENRDLAGVIRIERNGEVLVEMTAGAADLARGKKNRPDTHFTVGSVTKSMTASALLTLVEEGTVDLSAPISIYFPDYTRGGEMSVEQVILHRAGLPRDVTEEDRLRIDEDGFVAWLSDQELIAEPGEAYNYSNVGYRLLALLIEQKTGQSYADAIQERVLGPAGVEGVCIAEGCDGKDVATGYEVSSGNELIRPAPRYPSGPGPTGAKMTGKALIDWLHAVEAESIADLTPDDAQPRGSVRLIEIDGEPAIGLQGSEFGGGASVAKTASDGVTIAYAFNIASYPLWGAEELLFKLVAGEDVPPLPALPETVQLTDRHRSLAGRYLHPQFGIVAIEEDDGTMVLRVEALNFEFDLTPVTDGRLLWRFFNTAFEPADNGELRATQRLIGQPEEVFSLPPA